MEISLIRDFLVGDINYWKSKYKECINEMNNINAKYDVNNTYPVIYYRTLRIENNWKYIYDRKCNKKNYIKILEMKIKYYWNGNIWRLKKGYNKKWKKCCDQLETTQYKKEYNKKYYLENKNKLKEYKKNYNKKQKAKNEEYITTTHYKNTGKI
jgi:hypothetical protein